MMMREQIAMALAQTISTSLQLAQPMEVIAAPPSEQAAYPACALWLETFQLVDSNDDPVLVDVNGVPQIGALASLESQDLDAPAMLTDAAYLASVGVMRGAGRIWVGARHAPKREELENLIVDQFYQDDLASGRIMVRVDRPRVSGYQLPFSWWVAAFVENVEWTAEFAFAERLWDWIHFTVDVDMLIPRTFPLVKELRLMLSNDISQQVLQPSDIALLRSLEQYDIANDGTITPVH